ncbi:MAG: hypothetical protein N3F09_08675 [Bacteroidia bacterium]|nr:hypothetical protein [Bacteroidia bacterium]
MKNMLLVTTALLLWSNLFAQKEDKRSIKEARRKFIEEKLELTDEEKQKFWPVADEYLFKEKELKMNFNLKMEFMPENPSDKEADEYYKLILKFNQDEYELNKTYAEKIKSIIGVKKTIRFFALRHEFKKEMIRRAGGKPPHHGKGHHPEH